MSEVECPLQHTICQETIVSRVKQINDGRQVVAAVAEAFAVMHNRVKACTISRPTHSRLCWHRILDPGNDSGAENTVKYISFDARLICTAVHLYFVAGRIRSELDDIHKTKPVCQCDEHCVPAAVAVINAVKFIESVHFVFNIGVNVSRGFI